MTKFVKSTLLISAGAVTVGGGVTAAVVTTNYKKTTTTDATQVAQNAPVAQTQSIEAYNACIAGDILQMFAPHNIQPTHRVLSSSVEIVNELNKLSQTEKVALSAAIKTVITTGTSKGIPVAKMQEYAMTLKKTVANDHFKNERSSSVIDQINKLKDQYVAAINTAHVRSQHATGSAFNNETVSENQDEAIQYDNQIDNEISTFVSEASVFELVNRQVSRAQISHVLIDRVTSIKDPMEKEMAFAELKSSIDFLWGKERMVETMEALIPTKKSPLIAELNDMYDIAHASAEILVQNVSKMDFDTYKNFDWKPEQRQFQLYLDVMQSSNQVHTSETVIEELGKVATPDEVQLIEYTVIPYQPEPIESEAHYQERQAQENPRVQQPHTQQVQNNNQQTRPLNLWSLVDLLAERAKLLFEKEHTLSDRIEEIQRMRTGQERDGGASIDRNIEQVHQDQTRLDTRVREIDRWIDFARNHR